MIAFRKVLFPVDFSERSTLAAPYVAALAEQFRSQVVLLHVVEPPPEVYGPLESVQSEVREQELKGFQREQFSRLDVERVLTVGDPARRITEYAANEGVDLITMPTHGYGPFRRFILGSVTAKVLHDAQCAVWTSAHVEDLPARETYGIRNLMCAADLDEKGTNLLKRSKELAERFEARLTVVHAVPATDVRPDMYLDTEFRVNLVELARKQMVAKMQEVDVQATLCIDAGDIARVIRHSAASHQADVLVIGRSSPGLMGRLKTHSYSIIRESPCPVLSL